MNWILRRSVGLIMAGVALFTGIGQLQSEQSQSPEYGSWPWLVVALFAWLAYLNLRPQRRVRRGRARDEDQ